MFNDPCQGVATVLLFITSTFENVKRFVLAVNVLCMLTNSMDQFLLEKLIVTQSRNSPPFMEPEGSMLCSQEPLTLPYLEPDELISFITLWIYHNCTNLLHDTGSFLNS